MSKKIQATIEDPLLKEMEHAMKKEKFFETSEFVKHCIRRYLVTNDIVNAQTPLSTEIPGLLDIIGSGDKGIPSMR